MAPSAAASPEGGSVGVAAGLLGHAPATSLPSEAKAEPGGVKEELASLASSAIDVEPSTAAPVSSVPESMPEPRGTARAFSPAGQGSLCPLLPSRRRR